MFALGICVSISSLSQLNAVIDITSDNRKISIEEVWGKLVDWESQSDWMMGTKVWSTKADSNGVGVRVSAFSGILPHSYKEGSVVSKLGILDTMEVTAWNPPYSCEVIHVGKIIKGSGEFKLEQIEEGVRFYWQEIIDAPWPLLIIIKPAILIAVKLSLRRFRRLFINI